MFNFFKKAELGTGLLKDPRSPAERARDWEAREILMARPVEWQEKSAEGFRRFPIFDQSSSGSCVAMTITKLLGIDNFLEENKFVHYSSRDIYTRRSNYGSPGMWTQNAMELGYKHGATLEQLMPSQKLNEQRMNDFSDRKSIDEEMALVGKGGNYLSFLFSFDQVAQILEQGKAVALGSNFNPGDWKKAEVITRKNGTYAHLVAAIDYCLWKGKKAIVFDNSWGQDWGLDGQGILVEGRSEGIHGLCYYFQDLKNTWRSKDPSQIEKPQYHFDRDLVYGETSPAVSMLQKILQYEELFPIEVTITGYYGSITTRSVKLFQEKYKVASQEEIDSVAGKRVGPKTRTVLNQLFA